MRSIKFRAWDKDQEKMVYSEKFPSDYDFSINEKGEMVCAINCCYCDTFGDEHDDWAELENIMESTGFSDKNGKEIYEGDILHRDAYWDLYVEFHDGAFCLVSCVEVQRINWTPIPIKDADISHREVVGNIYENPDTLTT